MVRLTYVHSDPDDTDERRSDREAARRRAVTPAVVVASRGRSPAPPRPSPPTESTPPSRCATTWYRQPDVKRDDLGKQRVK